MSLIKLDLLVMTYGNLSIKLYLLDSYFIKLGLSKKLANNNL